MVSARKNSCSVFVHHQQKLKLLQNRFYPAGPLAAGGALPRLRRRSQAAPSAGRRGTAETSARPDPRPPPPLPYPLSAPIVPRPGLGDTAGIPPSARERAAGCRGARRDAVLTGTAGSAAGKRGERLAVPGRAAGRPAEPHPASGGTAPPRARLTPCAPGRLREAPCSGAGTGSGCDAESGGDAARGSGHRRESCCQGNGPSGGPYHGDCRYRYSPRADVYSDSKEFPDMAKITIDALA
ncbi:uncharacterized protein LOC143694669 [Agelaius phoeniceus]|uniref:uncharacterized protein LOC143694669 n=1 Tax=Agelaius phoeniceus TaxID=39638 RepID=UPI004054AC13